MKTKTAHPKRTQNGTGRKRVSYTVIFERNEDGGYTVTVPALPGLVTEGRNAREAKQMARDAIVCYVEGLLKDGEPIPEEREVRNETVTVAVTQR